MNLVNWNVEWAMPCSRKGKEILRRVREHDPEVACLTEAPVDLMDRDVAAARSPATRRAYRTWWNLFTHWANRAGLASPPAQPATVRASATAIGTGVGSGGSQRWLPNSCQVVVPSPSKSTFRAGY